MLHFKLTNKEVARVKVAAKYAGFQWQPICRRPKTARQFFKRIEAEMCRRGSSHEVVSVFGNARPEAAVWCIAS